MPQDPRQSQCSLCPHLQQHLQEKPTLKEEKIIKETKNKNQNKKPYRLPSAEQHTHTQGARRAVRDHRGWGLGLAAQQLQQHGGAAPPLPPRHQRLQQPRPARGGAFVPKNKPSPQVTPLPRSACTPHPRRQAGDGGAAKRSAACPKRPPPAAPSAARPRPHRSAGRGAARGRRPGQRTEAQAAAPARSPPRPRRPAAPLTSERRGGAAASPLRSLPRAEAADGAGRRGGRAGGAHTRPPPAPPSAAAALCRPPVPLHGGAASPAAPGSSAGCAAPRLEMNACERPAPAGSHGGATPGAHLAPGRAAGARCREKAHPEAALSGRRGERGAAGCAEGPGPCPRPRRARRQRRQPNPALLAWENNPVIPARLRALLCRPPMQTGVTHME